MQRTVQFRGTKLTKLATGGSAPKVDYVGNHIYKNGVLDYIISSEGRILFTNGIYTPEYNINDHLGNVRLVLNKDGAVQQSNSYYPFGLAIKSLSYNISGIGEKKNKYLMQGKEMQSDFGYNVYDFEARHFDPTLIRTTTIDPMAEKYFDFSGYSFLGNNPMFYVDPTGEEIIGSVELERELWQPIIDFVNNLLSSNSDSGSKSKTEEKSEVKTKAKSEAGNDKMDNDSKSNSSFGNIQEAGICYTSNNTSGSENTQKARHVEQGPNIDGGKSSLSKIASFFGINGEPWYDIIDTTYVIINGDTAGIKITSYHLGFIKDGQQTIENVHRQYVKY